MKQTCNVLVRVAVNLELTTETSTRAGFMIHLNQQHASINRVSLNKTQMNTLVTKRSA